MTEVLGSKQEHLIVVPHSPTKHSVKRLLLVLLLLVLALGGFTLGELNGMKLNSDAKSLVETLQDDQAQSLVELSVLRQQVAALRVGHNIDQQALDEVRLTIKQLEAEKFQLQQDLVFYKNIMAPGADDRGLQIQKFDLKPTADAQKYQLKLMLTQVAGNDSFLAGIATVNIVGLDQGVLKTLPLHKVSAQVKQEKIKLGFKYFQHIPGPDARYAELMLPEGFEPEYVHVIAQSRGSKPKRVEQKFKWLAVASAGENE